MKKALLTFTILSALTSGFSGSSMAQCFGRLALAPAFFEFDHLVRIAVHFGDASSIPEYVVCSRSMLPGENVIEVPIWAYNLHEGIEQFEFAVVSNESLGVFIPDNCFGIVSSTRSCAGGACRIDLVVQACEPLGGPVLLGHAQVVRVAGRDPVYVDLVPNGQTGRMLARDQYGLSHGMFSPQHGGFVGVGYLYACQKPLCEEPNIPVRDFEAVVGPSCSIKVTWMAGSGNRTMIRFRTDKYPTGYSDGQLVIEVPSLRGESQYFYHTSFPSPATIYYKAFSLTRDGSNQIVRDSFVECSSVDTLAVSCQIAAEPASWGSIKSLYR